MATPNTRRPRIAPDAGGSPKFRTRWRHVLTIDREIRSGKAPNCPALCALLEVSRRTILRDLDFLRDDLGAPVAYDAAKGGYIYTQPHWSLPNFQISEGDLLAFLVAESALKGYAGIPWADRLHRVFDRLAASLPARVQVRPEDLLQRVRLDADAPATVDPAILQMLAEAVEHNRTLQVRYCALGRTQEKEYVLDPYVLRRARGAWYLAGRVHATGQIPVLNISRVREAIPTGQEFDYVAADFDPDAYFADTFGVMHHDQPQQAIIEFTGTAALLVRERQWHASQKFTELAGGRLRMEVTVSHLWDIWPWVLSWGHEAKVIAPKQLAQIIAKESAATSRLYSRAAAKP